MDLAYGLIRKWTATHAAAHNGARLEDVLDRSNTASEVWADTAYRSAMNEAMLLRRGFVYRIHRKKPKRKPTPQRADLSGYLENMPQRELEGPRGAAYGGEDRLHHAREPVGEWLHRILHARLRDPLLDGGIFYSLAEARIIVKSGLRHYNKVRPHQSFGYSRQPPRSSYPSWARGRLRNPDQLRRPR